MKINYINNVACLEEYMKSLELNKIKKTLEKSLDHKRYEHTLAVAYTASALAMCHGIDVNSALLAGLLHDCAKCLSDTKKISICAKYNIEITETERKNPSLLHAKVGGLLAKYEYQIDNFDIINAITSHTTGRPAMSELEKIIFVADYIEPGRNKASNLDIIRKLAFHDLDIALLKILEDTLEYLRNSNQIIDSTTQKTYEYYYNQKKGD